MVFRLGPESNLRLLETHFAIDLHRGNCDGEIPHPHQIVGRAGEGEDPIHFAHSTMPNLAHQRSRLQAAEALFDPFLLSLAQRVTRIPRSLSINRTATWSRMIVRHTSGNITNLVSSGHSLMH